MLHLSIHRPICLSPALACTRWKADDVARWLNYRGRDIFALFCIPLCEFAGCLTVVPKGERVCYLPLWRHTHLCDYWTLAADSVRTLNWFRIILAIALNCPYFYSNKHRMQFAQDCLNQLSVERDCSFFCLGVLNKRNWTQNPNEVFDLHFTQLNKCYKLTHMYAHSDHHI